MKKYEWVSGFVTANGRTYDGWLVWDVREDGSLPEFADEFIPNCRCPAFDPGDLAESRYAERENFVETLEGRRFDWPCDHWSIEYDGTDCGCECDCECGPGCSCGCSYYSRFG